MSLGERVAGRARDSSAFRQPARAAARRWSARARSCSAASSRSALARGQGLEPFDFALGRDEPAVDRRGVFPRPAFHRSAEGFEFLVEKSALRCGVVALLPDHRYLLAGRLEAIAGGPVERPGHHRRQPRAHKPQRCKSPGERPGDGGRQKEPREDHRCSGDEHRAQPEEPFERDQLPAEMEGHVAIEGGE